MSDKCFCHFNGYEVKDANARKRLGGIVTPQMFGAKANGTADDTSAVREAIASGSAVYFPKGTYLITETIVINKAIRLYGDGIEATTVKYTGTGFLFEISTEYTNPAFIEKMWFQGADTNSFVKCSSGSWGACVHMRDFYMYGFNQEWLRLESAFSATFDNARIRTLGKCVMTTHDGTATTVNFTNRISFRDCYIANRWTTDEKAPVLFEFFNVRQIEFWNCALEFCDVLFKDFLPEAWVNSENYSETAVIAQDIRMDKCWLESVGTIYDFKYNSNAPTADLCRYTRVDQFNANAGEAPDHIYGNDTLYFRNGETSSIQSAIFGAERTISEALIINPTDGQGSYFYPYSIKTNGATFNIPVNSKIAEVFDETSTSYDLRQIARYSFVSAKYKVTVMFRYSNTAINIWEAELFSFSKGYYLIKAEKVYSTTQAESVGATENVYMSSTGVIKAETNVTAKQIAIVTNYNFNKISML